MLLRRNRPAVWFGVGAASLKENLIPNPPHIIFFSIEHHGWPSLTRATPCISFLEPMVWCNSPSCILKRWPPVVGQRNRAVYFRAPSPHWYHSTAAGFHTLRIKTDSCDWWCQHILWKPMSVQRCKTQIVMVDGKGTLNELLSMCWQTCYRIRFEALQRLVQTILTLNYTASSWTHTIHPVQKTTHSKL